MNRLFEAIAHEDILSERCEELGITSHRVRQYLGLFCFLVVIYSLCLSSYVKFLSTESTIPGGFGFGDVMKPLLGTCLVSALPFGVLAYSDKTWRSGDAARVILGAGIVVYMGLSLQYEELCPMCVLLALPPFTLSAQTAHTVGTLCQRWTRDDTQASSRP
jgi:hypothetical protein